MRNAKKIQSKIPDWCEDLPCDFSGGRRICAKCQRPTVLDVEAMRIYYGSVAAHDEQNDETIA